MTDPRMSLTLRDRTLIGFIAAQERELERRRALTADADYLGWPTPSAEPRPQTEDELAEEIAQGVLAGLKAKAAGVPIPVKSSGAKGVAVPVRVGK